MVLKKRDTFETKRECAIRSYKVYGTTVPAAIRELEKIEMVRRSGGNYKLDHAVTKKHKMEADALMEAYLKSSKSFGEIMTFLNP